MAIISRDDFFSKLSSGVKWDAAVAFKRGNPLPLDDSSVFQSYEAATTYAASATAYPGQIIAVVASDATTIYAINQLGELQELGGSNAPMLFVATESEMLALNDIEVGQQVYREDTHTIWLFKGGDATSISNWVESAAQNDTKWQGTDDKVNFYALTSTAYKALESKNASTLYFLSDTGKIYKGTDDYTQCIVVPETMPSVSDAIRGKIYFDQSTLEIKATLNNADWYTLYPGHLTDGANWATADSNKLATIGLIKKGIQEAVAAINLNATFNNATGTLSVGSGTGAVLTGVAHDVTYDSANLKITIPVYGGDDVVVNIPKDKFVTAGQYYEDYPLESPTHHKVIVLTIDNQEDPVIIPAESLVNIYTASNEGKDIVVTISDDNKISAAVKLDPSALNALSSSANGLMVDVSGKLDKLSSAVGTKVVISKADGTIEESEVSIKSTGDMGNSSTDIPVASVIAAAISTAISNLQSTISGSLDGKLDKLSGTSEDAGKLAVVGADGTTLEIGTVKLSELATVTQLNNKVDKVVGTVDNLVTFGSDGAIKDSGKAVGGSTLNATPDANTVATEAAVADAMSWETI